MSNIYIKTNFGFSMGDIYFDEKVDLAQLLDKLDNGEACIEINLLVRQLDSQIERYTRIRFTLTPKEYVSGEFKRELKNGQINIVCNCIFKLSVRAQWDEDVLNQENKWEIAGVTVLHGGRGYLVQPEFGVEKHEVKWIRKSGDEVIDTYDFINVRTSKKKTELKD